MEGEGWMSLWGGAGGKGTCDGKGEKGETGETGERGRTGQRGTVRGLRGLACCLSAVRTSSSSMSGACLDKWKETIEG